MTRVLGVVLVLCAACGDDGSPAQPDAPVTPPIDGDIDAPPMMVGCSYTEQNDTGNDAFATSQREIVAASPTSEIVICGQIDIGHLAKGTLDIDSFQVTFPTETPVIVRLEGLEGLDASFTVYGGKAFDIQYEGARVHGDHAVRAASLPAGALELSAIVDADAAPSAPIPYKLRITPDNPGTRCPRITTAAAFTEQRDMMNQNDRNDVILVNTGTSPQESLTAANNDAPEDTNLTIAAGASTRVSGTFADVVVTGSYKDKDTYAFTTGANVNEVEIRASWSGTIAEYDVDLRLFEAMVLPSVGVAGATTEGDELGTFAVKPNTTYWLWSGVWRQSTGTAALPYDLSICGKTYAP